jgi:membrane-associated phospholipid phosphatase
MRRLMAIALALTAACAGEPTAPAPDGPRASATKFWEAGSSVAWNATARDLMVARAVGSPAAQVRILAYLSVAQYNAVVGAEATKDGAGHASPAAAAGGASVAVLKSFFPADGDLLEATLADQLASARWPGETHTDIAAGEAVGRAVGADVVAYAAADNTNLLPLPTAPVGPAFWTSSAIPAAPAIRSLYGTRPFALTSGDQFRPPPPPAFGSPAFTAALAEVRHFSDTRTAEQLAIAQVWAAQGAAYMNGVAAELIVRNHRTEVEAARILALANIAGFDATIGCFDAKFAYWLVRPSAVDPAITLPIGLPNHPSYISGHSCNTASYAAILARFFPSDRARLEAMTIEAGLSRIYGGLHYRFDCEAGQELGRQVAAQVLRTAPAGREAIALD